MPWQVGRPKAKMGPSTAGLVMACWAFGLGLAIWLAAALDVEEERCAPGEQEREGGREKERRLCQRGGVGVGGGGEVLTG
jgi:hypothetical protein